MVEFQGNVKIMDSAFAKHFPLHRVQTADYEALKSNWSKHQGLCWAWHFELVRSFQPSLVLTVQTKGCEVWMYFSPADVKYPESSESSFLPSMSSIGSSQSLATETRDPKRKQYGASSTDLDACLEPDTKRKRSSESSSDMVAPLSGFEDMEASADPHPLGKLVANAEEEDAPVQCIILQEFEWAAMMRGAAILLRPFQTHCQSLVALVRRTRGYSAVGCLDIKECIPFDQSNMMEECMEVYPSLHLRCLYEITQIQVVLANFGC